MDLKDELKQSRPFASPEEETYLALLRTSDQLNHAVEKFMRGHGITPAQYNVLRILRGASPGGLPCSEVGKRLVTRVPDVTRLLDRLEKKGWASRERRDRDRRVVTIKLTEEGKRLAAKLDEPVLRMHQTLLGHVSAGELATLCDLLAKIRRPVRDKAGNPSPQG